MDASLTNDDIATDAGILGTKILPNFGARNITTTGEISAADIKAGTSMTINNKPVATEEYLQEVLDAAYLTNDLGVDEVWIGDGNTSYKGKISNNQIDATADIDGSKINPDFGAKILTAGEINAGVTNLDGDLTVGSGTTNYEMTLDGLLM